MIPSTTDPVFRFRHGSVTLVDWSGTDPVLAGPPSFTGARQVQTSPMPAASSPSITPLGNEQTTISLPLAWIGNDEGDAWEQIMDWIANLPTGLADAVLETRDPSTLVIRKQYTFPCAAVTGFPASADNRTATVTLAITAGKMIRTGEPLRAGIPIGRMMTVNGSITQLNSAL